MTALLSEEIDLCLGRQWLSLSAQGLVQVLFASPMIQTCTHLIQTCTQIMQNVQHIMIIIIIIISISNVPICVAVGGHFILVPFWSHHVTAGICRDLQQFIDVPLKKLVQPGLKNPSLHGDQKPGTQMYPKTAGTGWYWMVLDV